MTQATLFLAAGMLAAIAVLAALADHRRGRRRDIDAVGFVPWTVIQLLAALGAIMALAFAVKG
ncbi:MAG: hypothetical protein ACFBQW_06050 [Sphingomonadaceae bacterium]